MHSLSGIRGIGSAVAYVVVDLMIAQPRGLDSDIPVVVEAAPYPRHPLPFMLAARLCGCAVLLTKSSCRLVGRTGNNELLLDRWDNGGSLADTHRAVAAASRALHNDGPGSFHGEEWHRDYARWEAVRVHLLKVQHQVAIACPALRVRRAGGQGEGEPEVVLQPYAAGTALGGVVWPAEAYGQGGPMQAALGRLK